MRVERSAVFRYKLGMDETLSNKIIQILATRWNAGERAISSETIYQDLVSSGTQPADYAMSEVFKSLKSQGMIKGSEWVGSEAVKQHGATIITWVNPTLL